MGAARKSLGGLPYAGILIVERLAPGVVVDRRRGATIEPMVFFVRAVVTGFALSLGAALFKKVAKDIGLGEDKDEDKDGDVVRQQDGATDPELHRYS